MVVFFIASGCSEHGHEEHNHNDTQEVVVVPPSSEPWELTPLENVSSEDGVVEFHLDARVAAFEYLPGNVVEVWSYNGIVPGPLIEASVGDRVIVHFRNNLPESTTVHWHGLRIPAEMDGTLAMQNPINPGESFTYDFVVQDEGLFWFHPHMHTDEQVARGLYGALVVRGPGDQIVEVESEEIIVLHDMNIVGDKIVLANDMMSLMNGREGNYVFANGQLRPIKRVNAGERHRLRIVNAASARFFRLALSGHHLHLIGTDGHLLEAPVEMEEILLVPGERVDLILTATGTPGAQFDMQVLPYNRGHGAGQGAAFPVFTVEYGDQEPGEISALPNSIGTFGELDDEDGHVELVLSEDMMDHGSGGHGSHGSHGAHGSQPGSGTMEPVFRINGEVFPDVTPVEAILGTTQIWTIVNDSEMDHPFHLHGFLFEVVDRNGEPVPYRAKRDTVNVAALETVRIAVTFDGYPGQWMFHCHILEHEERGMMGVVNVVEP